MAESALRSFIDGMGKLPFLCPISKNRCRERYKMRLPSRKVPRCCRECFIFRGASAIRNPQDDGLKRHVSLYYMSSRYSYACFWILCPPVLGMDVNVAGKNPAHNPHRTQLRWPRPTNPVTDSRHLTPEGVETGHILVSTDIHYLT